MIRVAAVGDVHLGADSAGQFRPHLSRLPEAADVLLLAGDLTRVGRIEEAAVVAAEFADVGVPVVAVLGNHDHHDGRPGEVSACLRDGGMVVLEGATVTVETPAGTLGVAGTKGFGGGFAGACGSEFGEAEMKAFAAHTRELAAGLEAGLRSLDGVTAKVALTHYAPIPETLAGERCEIYPFLGSYLLAEAVDAGGADLAVHGHAHGGSEQGATVTGVPVRNVAHPVIRTAYRVFTLGPG